MKYKYKITNCYRLDISFNSTEGLNKFTEFILKNNIKGLGFEASEKNISYIGFFGEEEMEMIRKQFPVN